MDSLRVEICQRLTAPWGLPGRPPHPSSNHAVRRLAPEVGSFGAFDTVKPAPYFSLLMRAPSRGRWNPLKLPSSIAKVADRGTRRVGSRRPEWMRETWPDGVVGGSAERARRAQGIRPATTRGDGAIAEEAALVLGNGAVRFLDLTTGKPCGKSVKLEGGAGGGTVAACGLGARRAAVVRQAASPSRAACARVWAPGCRVR